MNFKNKFNNFKILKNMFNLMNSVNIRTSSSMLEAIVKRRHYAENNI